MEIKFIVNNVQIEMEIRFEMGWKSSSKYYFLKKEIKPNMALKSSLTLKSNLKWSRRKCGMEIKLKANLKVTKARKRSYLKFNWFTQNAKMWGSSASELQSHSHSVIGWYKSQEMIMEGKGWRDGLSSISSSPDFAAINLWPAPSWLSFAP